MNLRNHFVKIFHLTGEEIRSRGKGPQVSEQWTVEMRLKWKSRLDFLSQDSSCVTRMQPCLSRSHHQLWGINCLLKSYCSLFLVKNVHLSFKVESTSNSGDSNQMLCLPQTPPRFLSLPNGTTNHKGPQRGAQLFLGHPFACLACSASFKHL